MIELFTIGTLATVAAVAVYLSARERRVSESITDAAAVHVISHMMLTKQLHQLISTEVDIDALVLDTELGTEYLSGYEAGFRNAQAALLVLLKGHRDNIIKAQQAVDGSTV